MRFVSTAALLAGTIICAHPAVADEPAADAAVTALAEIPRGKLSDAAVPTAYRVDTSFDPAKDGFTGRTEIDLTLKHPQTYIDLHGRNLTVSSIVARPAGGGETRWTGAWHQLDDTGVARIVFPHQLPAGPLTITFEYAGKYQSNASGLFHAKIGDEWYGWSQFQSIDARSAFPSFDDPGFKVPFTVTIRTPLGQTAVSNAPEVSNTVENGWQVHKFAPTLPMPTYLVAMMAGPFAVVEGAVPPSPQRDKPLPLRIVTPKTNAAQMAYALENSKPIVTLLEDYFGQGFPYPKLDQITSPLMPGAMENAGADLYEDSILILDENAPVAQKRTFGMVVAHELSHQWFGDLVTPQWWDDIWLNESFANWMGYTIGGAWRPDLNIGEGALSEGFAAMDTDSLIVGRPIHQPIASNDQVDAAFDTITYGKGGHVVSMIAAYLGPEKFRDGVRRYMAAHLYGNATSEDFFAAMAQAGGDARITAAMQSFTDQQGVPLITVARADGGYTVSQSRYAPIGTAGSTTSWGVPVCMRRGEARACELLTDTSTAFKLSGSGVLVPNASGTGYYRFELPPAEWDALIAEADTLGAAESLALADSLEASFRAGRAGPAQLIALAQKLAANPDSYASSAALQALKRLRQAGVFDEAADAAYRKWVGELYRRDFDTLGFDPRAGAYSGADPEVVQRRQRAVANLALAQLKEIEGPLLAAAESYLAGDTGALDAAFMGNALGVYIDRKGLSGAQALAAAALVSDDPVFRPAALGAVAGSGNPAIAQWVLAELLSKLERQSERTTTALNVARAGETRDLGYAWLTDNLAGLVKGTSGIFLVRGIPGALGGFCSAEKASEIGERFRPIFAGTPGALELERTIERIRNCGALKAARQAEVNAALHALR